MHPVETPCPPSSSGPPWGTPRTSAPHVEGVGPPVNVGPLGLPDVSITKLDAEAVVPHERGPVLVNLALVEPANLIVKELGMRQP